MPELPPGKATCALLIADMYWAQPSFVLGFHGCDSHVAESVFAGNLFLKPSHNSYDWLGHGVYFWENDPERAMHFAQTNTARRQAVIKAPAVIGAVIDLGHCFNLMEASTLQLLKDGYQILKAAMETAGICMPANNLAGTRITGDIMSPVVPLSDWKALK